MYGMDKIRDRKKIIKSLMSEDEWSQWQARDFSCITRLYERQWGSKKHF